MSSDMMQSMITKVFIIQLSTVMLENNFLKVT